MVYVVPVASTIVVVGHHLTQDTCQEANNMLFHFEPADVLFIRGKVLQFILHCCGAKVERALWAASELGLLCVGMQRE